MSFRNDTWCGDLPLKDTFPDLYLIAKSKDSFVADYISWDGGQRGWNPVFLKSMNDWELDVLSSFLEMLYSCELGNTVEDNWFGLLLVKEFLRFALAINL